MVKQPTETILKDWRYGQAQAERLCAELLHIENYESVDPQCPLGGPDGLKDLLCKYCDKKWVAACYFPTTETNYPEIEKKLIKDSNGIIKNGAEGITFFVNQKLTPGDRAKLVGIVKPYNLELYHIERMRALLDSPKGYGIRLEYLRITMAEEEQFSLWSTLGDNLTAKFIAQEKAITLLNKKVDIIMERTRAIGINLSGDSSSLTKTHNTIELAHLPTASLSVGNILWIHRLLTDDTQLPHQQRGIFRSVSVWIGGPDPTSARFIPAPANRIPTLIDQLLDHWCATYPRLIEANSKTIIKKLAEFHHTFLSIHPFLDANGRVARAILQQQVIELLNKKVNAIFADDPKSYFICMKQADEGNFEPLETLITACLE